MRILLLLLLAAVALVFCGCDDDGSGLSAGGTPALSPVSYLWIWQNPFPCGNDLYDVDFSDALHGCAVGATGTLVRTSDGGQNWVQWNCGTTMPLRRVRYVSAQDVWAIGSNSYYYDTVPEQDPRRLLHSTDGGDRWQRVDIGRTTIINNVIGANGWVWIVGEQQMIQRTRDGGHTWESVRSPRDGYLYDLVFQDQQTGYAVGRVVDPRQNYYQGIILKTTDGGASWDSLYSTDNCGLKAITLTETGRICAVGSSSQYYFLYSTDEGLTWTETADSGSLEPSEIIFVDDQRGWVAGSGTMQRTEDGGASWQSCGINPSGVALIDANNGWCVGWKGAIMKTVDSGVNWEARTHYVTQADLYDVQVVDFMTAWAVGNSGTVLRTTDGGEQWTAVTTGSSAHFRKIHFVTVLHGYAVGGTDQSILIAETLDGGVLWSLTEFHGLGMAVDFEVTPSGILWCALAGGSLIRSTDGGESWSPVFTGSEMVINDLYCVSDQEIWGVGGDYSPLSIYHSMDGGETWSTRSIQSGRYSGYRVWFADPQTGWVVGAYGLILHTTDGGNSWVLQESGTTATFYDVRFQGRDRGWACGYNGMVVTTNDGGANWHPQWTGSANPLYAVDMDAEGLGWVVGGYGTIQLGLPDLEVIPLAGGVRKASALN